MHLRKQLIKQEKARVTLIDLAISEQTPWHFLTDLVENHVCLDGHIELQCKKPNRNVALLPGEHHEIIPQQEHRLVNLGDGRATFLLVQSGQYDFISSEV